MRWNLCIFEVFFWQGSHFRLILRLLGLPFALQADLLLQVGRPFVSRVHTTQQFDPCRRYSTTHGSRMVVGIRCFDSPNASSTRYCTRCTKLQQNSRWRCTIVIYCVSDVSDDDVTCALWSICDVVCKVRFLQNKRKRISKYIYVRPRYST